MKRPILESESVFFICILLFFLGLIAGATYEDYQKNLTRREEIKAKAQFEQQLFHKLSP